MGTVTTLRMKAVQAVLRRVMEHHIAFNRHLGLKVESFDPEAPKLRFDMKPELVGNPMRQILHGGVISATHGESELDDTAAALRSTLRMLKAEGEL